MAGPGRRWSLEKQRRCRDEERRGRGEEASRSGQWEEIRKKPEERKHCKKQGENSDRESGEGGAGQGHRRCKGVGQAAGPGKGEVRRQGCLRDSRSLHQALRAAEPGLVFISVVNTSRGANKPGGRLCRAGEQERLHL